MKRFKKAYIEITNNCNLNCSFCPKNSREKKFMNAEEFTHVIEEIKLFANFIYLHLMGEPLMHPNLKELLDISKENEMKVNITTNGTLIKKNIDVILNSDAVRKVSFSVHSFEANEEDNSSDSKEKNIESKIKSNIEKLDNYINDILEASTLLAEKDKIAVLKLWNLDSTNNDAEDKDGRNDLNKHIIGVISNYFNCDSDSVNKTLIEDGNIGIKKHIYLQVGEKFEWPIETSDKNNFEKIFCYGLLDQIGILASGDVVPCCLDSEGKIILGNVFKESLKDIIESERVKDFTEKIRSGIAPAELCKKCTYARKKV